MLKENTIKTAVEAILERFLPEGGFALYDKGLFRPDATAWAALALSVAGDGDDTANRALSRLATDQMEDGRVCISKDNPQIFWPTAPAVLAWHHASMYHDSRWRAIEFLLANWGKHWQKKKDSPAGHDTALRGWPWIEETHSWVEPTSLVLMALVLNRA